MDIIIAKFKIVDVNKSSGSCDVVRSLGGQNSSVLKLMIVMVSK